MQLEPLVEERLEDGRLFSMGVSENGYYTFYIKDPSSDSFTIVSREPLDADGCVVMH